MRDDEREPADGGDLPDDHLDARAVWVTVWSFATGLEADIARGVLEEDGIPVFVQGNSPGIFGLAFQGTVTGGIELRVPTPERERAIALLDDWTLAGDAAGESGNARDGAPDGAAADGHDDEFDHEPGAGR